MFLAVLKAHRHNYGEWIYILSKGLHSYVFNHDKIKVNTQNDFTPAPQDCFSAFTFQYISFYYFLCNSIL